MNPKDVTNEQIAPLLQRMSDKIDADIVQAAAAEHRSQLQLGDKVTIQGLRRDRRFKCGFNTNCEPGQETVLTVQELPVSMGLRPAILSDKP